MKNYLKLIKHIINNGTDAMYRNGIRRSCFNQTLEFDLRKGFPLVTTKKVNWKTPLAEMLWFISGSTNTKDLVKQGVPNIWDMWQLHEDDVVNVSSDFEVGDIGPMYGYLWRKWPNVLNKYPGFSLMNKTIDQLRNVVESIKKHPHTTRHFVSAFNPVFAADPDISPQENILQGRGCLNPCHRGFTCIVRDIDNVKHLSLHFEMGSNDVAIGMPYNIAGYALLLTLIAKEVDMVPHMLYYNGVDVHLYEEHFELARMQAELKPGKLPVLHVNQDVGLFDCTIDDLMITGYEPVGGHIPYKLK